MLSSGEKKLGSASRSLLPLLLLLLLQALNSRLRCISA
jgi:hypothetical protein